VAELHLYAFVRNLVAAVAVAAVAAVAVAAVLV
jgi:hypothetical protein